MNDPETHGNRRRYLRYGDEATHVLLRGHGLLGRLKAEERELLDYNRYGLSFLHDVDMDPGVVLALEVDAGEMHVTGIPGVVRDTQEQGDDWRVGVQFAPDRLRAGAAEKLQEQLHELEKLLKRRR